MCSFRYKTYYHFNYNKTNCTYWKFEEKYIFAFQLFKWNKTVDNNYFIFLYIDVVGNMYTRICLQSEQSKSHTGISG